MKRFLWLLVACSISLAACGNADNSARTTAMQPISSERFYEEFQEEDNEVQPLVGLHEALQYHHAVIASYLKTTSLKAELAAKKKAAALASQAAAKAPPEVAPSAGFESDAFMHRLAMCETGGTMDQRATSNTNPQYLGYFQFAMSTWRSVGGPGDPRDHSYAVQVQYARINITPANFSGQHPHCSKVMRREGWW